jgi:peptide/nickel transport system permease protein
MKKTIFSQILTSEKWENVQRNWYKFSQNRLSIIGLITIFIILFLAIFAPFVTVHPESVGRYVNFEEAKKPPSLSYPFGTDIYGRDILTRIIYAFRVSLLMAFVVLLIAAPTGVIIGLIAGYFHGTWIDILIMRITDIFLSLPILIMALAICAILPHNLLTTMIAISLLWWTWYCRMVYGLVISIRGEFFIQAVELIGAGKLHILFKEIEWIRGAEIVYIGFVGMKTAVDFRIRRRRKILGPKNLGADQ